MLLDVTLANDGGYFPRCQDANLANDIGSDHIGLSHGLSSL